MELTFGFVANALWETLYMTLVSTLIAYALAIPLAVILATTRKGGIYENRAINIMLGTTINILRSVPFLLLAIFVIPVTRAIIGTAIGSSAMIVPLVFAATPFITRLIESAMLEVDKGLVEAAKSMGATRLQIILKMYIPESLPAIILSSGVSVISIMAFAAMAGFVGGGGLGMVAIEFGWNRSDSFVMFVCIGLLIVVTQVFQFLALGVYKKIDKK